MFTFLGATGHFLGRGGKINRRNDISRTGKGELSSTGPAFVIFSDDKDSIPFIQAGGKEGGCDQNSKISGG